MPAQNSKTTNAPRNTMTACNSILQSILESINRLADNPPTPSNSSTDLISSLHSLNESMQTIANNIVTLNVNVAKIADSLPIMENINTNIVSLTSHLTNPSINSSHTSTISPLPTLTVPIINSDSEPHTSPVNSRNQPSPDNSSDQPRPCSSRSEVQNVAPPHDQEAINIKSSISHIWNKKSSDHSRHYWQKVRNHNTSSTYSLWIDNSPIVIPKDFKIKPIIGEPDNQREIRERNAKMNLANEIELLILRSESHHEKCLTIDSEMKSLIAEKSSGPTRDILINM